MFVNHGRLAGSSEPHPHAQVVGLEITNLSELQEKEALCHERCFLCHAAHRPHLVVNGPGCFIRTPTAPMSSYDLLVVLEHGHGVRLDPEALAWGVTTSVRAIYALLGPVAYNVIFHFTEHPHAHVLPRLGGHSGHAAGGMHVISLAPEEAAERFRNVLETKLAKAA